MLLCVSSNQAALLILAAEASEGVPLAVDVVGTLAILFALYVLVAWLVCRRRRRP